MASSQYYHEYYLKHRETYKARADAWNRANPHKRKAAVDRYRWSDKGVDAKLNSTFLRQYGITLEQYNRMLQEQNGLCAICNQEEARKLKGIVQRLSIDHDHITKKVRKLLCDRCNNLLGRAQDSILRLQEAINYLKEFSRGDK